MRNVALGNELSNWLNARQIWASMPQIEDDAVSNLAPNRNGTLNFRSLLKPVGNPLRFLPRLQRDATV